MNFSLDYINEATHNDLISRNEILQLFITNLPEYLQSLEQSFNENDLDELKKSAHKLKTPLFTLNAKTLINRLEFIELEVNQTTPQYLIENSVKALCFEIQLIIDQLKSIVEVS
jgi:HPt (histidine-containing phosphotransfer) domain-containing protein